MELQWKSEQAMWESIRRFGLEYCDLETMLQNLNSLMRTLMLNIDSRNKKGLNVLFCFISITLSLCYFHVFVLSMGWVIVTLTPQTGDWIGATIVASLGITCVIGTTKLLYLLLYIREIRDLIELYRACDEMVVPDSRFAANLMVTLKVVKRRAVFFWLTLMWNGAAYITKPFLMAGRHLLEDSFTIYGFEPKFETPNYEISNLLMAGAVVFVVYVPSNIGAFLIVITGYSEAQMLALCKEMLHLYGDAQQHYRDRIGEFYNSSVIIQNENVKRQNEHAIKEKLVNEYIRQHLYGIIKVHTTNIYMVQKVENVYRKLIAIEFILLTAGIIVELLGRIENTYLQMPFSLVQVAMDCFSGQKVMDASIAFERAVYASMWQNLDVRNRKTMLLMLQMSQKTMRLSAGGVTMLSFTSFASVMRIIYSGYTALRQLY